MHAVHIVVQSNLDIEVGLAADKHVLDSAAGSQSGLRTLPTVLLGVDDEQAIANVLVKGVASTLHQSINLREAWGSTEVQHQKQKPALVARVG